MKNDVALQDIPLDKIDTSTRLRPVSEAHAIVIADDILKIGGLINPLTVCPGPNDTYKLIAGGHRFRALEICEFAEAMCIVHDDDPITAQLIEISENLKRNDLSPLDRAICLDKEKRLYLEEYPETAHGGDRGSQHTGGKSQSLRHARFTKEVAEKTGLSERSIQDAVALIKNLSPDVIDKLRDTETANNGVQLKALAKLDHEDQAKVVNALVSGEVKTVAQGKAVISGRNVITETPEDIWTRKMTALWATGRKNWQDKFFANFGAD